MAQNGIIKILFFRVETESYRNIQKYTSIKLKLKIGGIG